jgi:hypothetical protein
MPLELHGRAIELRAIAAIDRVRQIQRATSSVMAPSATEQLGALKVGSEQATLVNAS